MNADLITTAKDVVVLAAVVTTFVQAVRVARQSKQVTDDIAKGAQAHRDIRGNPDAETDRERRGFFGDFTWLLGQRNGQGEPGEFQKLQLRVAKAERRNQQLEREIREMKLQFRLRTDQSVRIAEPEGYDDTDTGRRSILRRNTPNPEGNNGTG